MTTTTTTSTSKAAPWPNVSEAEMYAALVGGKMSQDFLSQFPLSQILIDLRRRHGTAASSWEGRTDSIGFNISRDEKCVDGEGFKLDSQGFLSTAGAAIGSQFDELGIGNKGPASDYWENLADSRTYADPLTLDSAYRKSTKATSHAENLIKIAPHLRHISQDSLDMDGVMTIHGGAISSMLANPIFQQCINSSGSTSVLSGKGKKRQKQLMDAEVASLLSQKLNRQIAAELASFVGALAHEMSLEEFASLENTLFTKLFSLVNSKDSTVTDRMAGIYAIDFLLDVSSSDEEKKSIKFANSISSALRTATEYDFLAAATLALGRMAMGSANVDFVEFEVSRALEWLRSDRSDRRLAAALTLKELARNAPTTFYSKTNQSSHGAGSNEFLDYIFPVLRDPQPIVRACAVDALSDCLQFLIKRQHRSTTGYLCQIYSNMMDGLSGATKKNFLPGSEDVELHGCILVLVEMLNHTGFFMLPRFEEVCEVVFNLTNHPKALIRLEVARLCPRLARTCPSVFQRRVLATALDFLIQTGSNHSPAKSVIDLRPSAYLALGQLSLAVTEPDELSGTSTAETRRSLYSASALCDRLDDIFSLVKIGLARSSMQSATDVNVTRAALSCGANVVKALGDRSLPYVKELLDGMYRSGLSNDLIHSLRSVAASIPSKQRVIEHRLLEELSICLAGTSFSVEYDPPLLQHDEVRTRGRQRSKSQDGPEVQMGSILFPEVFLETDKSRISINLSSDQTVVAQLVLSLRTLGSFADNRGLVVSGGYEALLPFVKDVVTKYLAHPMVEVRKEAALCCCHLLLPPILTESPSQPENSRVISSSFSAYGASAGVAHWFSRSQVGSFSSLAVEEVLKTLTTSVVSDPSPIMRLCVIRSLDIRYDPYLCQTHHLPPLFLLLRDETFCVRAAALELLGRLSIHNPAPILPPLRRLLLEVLTELRSGGDAVGGRETATRLLIVFIKSEALHRLVHPYIATIISSLPLRGVVPRLASASLEALGELAEVERANMFPWVGQLVPCLLDIMQDYSSATKQTTSFRTLGQIAGSTGYVITPYLHYPQLLPLASAVLPGTKRAPWSLRREVIRTFGILGAVDPQKYTSVSSKSRKRGGWGGGYFVEDEEEASSEPVLTAKAGALSFVDSTMDQHTSKQQQMQPTKRKGHDAMVTATAVPSEHRFVGIDDEDDDEPAHFCMYEQYSCMAQPVSKLSPPQRLSPLNEDFYSTVAVQALTRILKDPSLAVHHGMAMQAIMFTFNALGLKCVKYLPRILPHLLQTVRTCNRSALREALMQQISKLSKIVKDHLRPYVDSIFSVVEEFWASRHLPTILLLVEHMAEAVPEHFTNYVPRLVPLLLASLDAPRASEWAAASEQSGAVSSTSEAKRMELVLRSIRALKGILTDYLHLLIPSLVKLVDTVVSSTSSFVASDGKYIGEGDDVLSRVAVVALETLSAVIAGDSSLPGNVVGLNSHSVACPTTAEASQQVTARAAQPLIRILGRFPHPCKSVGMAIVDTLCVCAVQLGREQWMFFYHASARNAILSWQTWVSSSVPSTPTSTDGADNLLWSGGLSIYDKVAQSLLQRDNSLDSKEMVSENVGVQEIHGHLDLLNHTDNLSDDGGRNFDVASDIFDTSHGSLPPIQPVNQTSTFRVNQVNLQRAWDVSQRTTREDWDEWMRRFSVQLLRESPNAALRAAAGLAHAFPPLARELFCAAFLCCWVELSDQYQKNLVQSLEVAFVSSDVSPEILQTLLNLAEFMERDGDGGLPINISVLAQLALKCRAYAKALHYKEREHKEGNSGSCVEALISINKKLDLPEAALGVLKATQHELEHCSIAHAWGVHPSLFGSEHYGFSPEIQHSYHRQMILGQDNRFFDESGSIWAGVEVQESWLAKLGSWSEALSMYERRLKEQPSDVDAILGCMHCLDARGDWKRVLELAETSWSAITGNEDEKETVLIRGDKRSNVAALRSRDHRKAMKYCAQAAWRLGKWEELEKYASQLVRGTPAGPPPAQVGSHGTRDVTPRVDFDGAFYSAVLHIHREEWPFAGDAIEAARRAMESRFTALMSESYKRAYPNMVTAQTLAEMEEIIAYLQLKNRAAQDTHRHSVNKANPTEARSRLLAVWRKRLAGCRVDAEVHSSIMAVRSLVLGPTDEVDATLTLSVLSRQAHCHKLAERVLCNPLAQLGADLNGPVFGFGIQSALSVQGNNSYASIERLVIDGADTILMKYGAEHVEYSHRLVRKAGGLERINVQHRLYFAYLKHLWATGNREEAMSRLEKLSAVVELVATCEKSQNELLRGACWLKLGDWKLEQSCPAGIPLSGDLQMEVLLAYKKATAAKADDYRAWHAWSLMNFRLAQHCHELYFHRSDSSASLLTTGVARPKVSTVQNSMKNHVVAAVQGFVKAVSYGTKRWSASVQQDMLNLLTCLFKYGDIPEVAESINEGLACITLEAWLGVLPQLLARIQIKCPSIRSTLHRLLVRLGARHPQALMYPLSVLLKSPLSERKAAAESLMNSLKAHSNDLVEQALMVSSELIRVAILWLELWHEGLEDASRLYFGDGNVSGMLDVLLPLHEQIEKGPSTLREQDFLRSFGRDLAEAHSYLREYIQLTTSSGGTIPTQGGFNDGHNTENPANRHNAEAESALNQAWDLYYTVFRRINKQLPGLTRLELSSSSPALMNANSLELGVPGSYRVDGSYVKIEKFKHSVQVITSKQRPRKIVLQGSDGKDYVFLLKGHEDLRQDERVMQLFGLVNALLARDRRTNKHDLNIRRYAITPLSHDAGVVSWVPHTDTLHSLIRDYRESKKVLLNMENREMTKLAPDYDLLTVMQKVEVFEASLQRTVGKGNDLYEVLWIKSSDSEEWLEHRTKYTRSLAVMSIVGYILGLGDRHPSNLMLDQISGRILHIDFGDCFEVAMHREKYPETIPFRLTRMLINAMEVSKIEGSYRSTCERTMSVLRDNRDSLVAMLEAFVYDPLISWRLLGQASVDPQDDTANKRPGNTRVSTDSSERPATQREKGEMSVKLKLLSGPITEGQQEDEDGDENEDGLLLDSTGETPLRHASEVSVGVQHSSLAQNKSLQMYSNIQSMAANLSTSSRIASIAVGASDRAAVEGSLARSRIDKSVRQREVISMLGGEEAAVNEEALNEKALKVIRRVQDKLTGTDFGTEGMPEEPLDVADQVQRLIVQATSSENLCQLFIGWCAFW